MEITQHAQFLATFATYLCFSILDIDAFIIATIDITALRRGEWKDVERKIRLERINRRIDDFGNTRYYHNTRFTKDELKQLVALYFGRMDETEHTHVQNHFSYEDTLLIALHCKSSSSPHNKLSQARGGGIENSVCFGLNKVLL